MTRPGFGCATAENLLPPLDYFPILYSSMKLDIRDPGFPNNFRVKIPLLYNVFGTQ